MVVTDNEIEQEEQAEEEDELFPEALEFVVDQQKASTSLIQRRFRIGYNRAARIIAINMSQIATMVIFWKRVFFFRCIINHPSIFINNSSVTHL